MKNSHLERLRRKMREYHRHHPWGLDGGLFIPHEYPEGKANKLSWWDDVGFILNGRRVIVNWLHPRRAYLDAIEQQAFDDVPAPSTPSTFEKFLSGQEPGTKHWRKLGRSRKKVIAETMPNTADEWIAFYDAVNAREDELGRVGIDLEVIPSMRIGLCSTATTIDLVAPMEVRSKEDIRTLAMLAKRLLKRETTIADEWPGYSYGRDTWLSEAGLRGRRQAEAVMALDCAVESRLHNQVGPAYDALRADPSRAVTADKVRERLASEHAKGQGTKKIATIDEMNEGAAAGWAGEAHQFTPPDIAS